MRYLCVLLVLLGMPLSASAQHRQRSGHPPAGVGAIGLPLPPIGLPTQIQQSLEWRVPTPSWERPQTPAWERQGPPPWERGYVAQPVKPVQHHRQRVSPNVIHQHQRRQVPPSVVYVVQPYPVAQPYPVYVTVVAPAAPEPEPAAPSTPAVEPEEPPLQPPVVVPIGSRTLYVIPGCYLGNVPPDETRLREGCDLSQLKIHPPR